MVLLIAEIKLFPHKEISVIEIEREDRAISTLIYILNNHQYKTFIYQRIFKGVIKASGTWNRNELQLQNLNFSTLRHGKVGIKHRAERLINKIIEI